MPDIKSVAQSQFLEVIGKLIGLRNPSALQEDRNDGDAALQRGPNLVVACRLSRSPSSSTRRLRWGG